MVSMETLRAHRNRIVFVALSRALLAERRTIFADVLAHRVVDLLAHQVDERDVQRWILELCDDRVRAQDLYHLLPLTVSAAIDVLALHEVLTPETIARLSSLQREIDVATSLQRAVNRSHTGMSVDPIDAKIDQLMYELSARDTITSEHSRAVSLWCLRVARRMKLPEHEAHYAARGGAVHDVGKLKTPPAILTAERNLDEAEWAIMRRHVADGEQLIAAIPELRPFAPVVRWHHERFDGDGYPDKRRAGDLPIAVRIASVADAFNAMIARRPYRPPISPDRALEELLRHSGTQFDPNVVAAMVDVVRRPGLGGVSE